MERLRVLIVDDEAPARTRLRKLVDGTEELAFADDCSDGRTAVKAILSDRPDLVFLDIQMPEVSGFDVVNIVGPERMPPVIFVTAYDEYALQAFEVAALDYLLKPFDDERFAAAVERARERIRRDRLDAMSEQMMQLLQYRAHRPDDPESTGGEPTAPADTAWEGAGDAGAVPPFVTRVAVERRNGEVQLVPVDAVDYFEADGSYVNVHTRTRTHLIRERMKTLEARLDPEQFCRIHRSTIVNLERIESLEPYFHGEYKARLEDGTKLKVSRSRKETLEEQLRLL